MSDKLQRYQDALVELLSSEKRPEEIIDCIRKDRELSECVPDIDQWRPDLVRRAQQLVRKWGRTL